MQKEFKQGLCLAAILLVCGCVARPPAPMGTQSEAVPQTITKTVTATPSSHSDYLVSIWYWWLGKDGQDTLAIVVNITNHAGEPRPNDQGSVETASGRQYQLSPTENFQIASASNATTEFRFYNWPNTQNPTVFWFANSASEALADCNCRV